MDGIKILLSVLVRFFQYLLLSELLIRCFRYLILSLRMLSPDSYSGPSIYPPEFVLMILSAARLRKRLLPGIPETAGKGFTAATFFISSTLFLSVLLFIVLIAIFTYHFIIKKFNLEDVYASYYIVYIGIVIASVTAPLYNHISEAMIIFCFGLAAFMFLIIMTAYRHLTLETPDQFKPLICINAAPFALLLLGYLKTYTSISYSFVVFMFVMSIIFYIFAIWKLIEYRNLPFYPSYSAYAFPFVVAAMSTKATVTYLGTKGTYLGINYLNYLTQIQTLIAIILVSYVIVRYVVFLAKN